MADAAWAAYYKQIQDQQQAYQQQVAAQQQQAYQQQVAAAQQHQAAQQAQQYEQYRQKAWADYFAQQQQQQAQGQAAAASAAAGAGSTHAAGVAPPPSHACTQQRVGQVIGAGGSSGMLTQQSITHAAILNAARLRGTSAPAMPASTSAAFQPFAVKAPPRQLPAPAPVAAPAPAANPTDGWPKTLRMWVERAFTVCKSDAERSFVEKNLRARIGRANETNTLWSTDWEREPLPERSKLWLPPPNSLSGMSSADGGAKAGKKRKAKKGLSLSHMYGGHDDDDERGGGYSGEQRPIDPYEAQKRQKRAGRFVSPREAEKRDRWSQPLLPALKVDDGSGDISLDYTVVGTSYKVEKKYLRLTSAPDPSTVRPEPVLKQAIELIKSKCGQRTRPSSLHLAPSSRHSRHTTLRPYDHTAILPYDLTTYRPTTLPPYYPTSQPRLAVPLPPPLSSRVCSPAGGARYEGFGEERGQEQYIYLWEQMKVRPPSSGAPYRPAACPAAWTYGAQPSPPTASWHPCRPTAVNVNATVAGRC